MDLQFDRDEREALSDLIDAALTGLAFVFLAVLLVEYAFHLTPGQVRWLELAGWLIWAIFTVDFVVRLALAEDKGRFLRGNWLSGLAVLLPAFRVFRVLRALRVLRTVRLVRLVAGANRGARALGRIVGFAGAGYVVLLTALVIPLAAAGLAWLERGQGGAAIGSFGDALWWSATTVVQQGSERHPATAEGRALGVLLMTYALAVSGYITAALAALLLGRRRRDGAAPSPPPDHVPRPGVGVTQMASLAAMGTDDGAAPHASHATVRGLERSRSSAMEYPLT
jgi:voltage-gated potassium channel